MGSPMQGVAIGTIGQSVADPGHLPQAGMVEITATMIKLSTITTTLQNPEEEAVPSTGYPQPLLARPGPFCTTQIMITRT